MANIPIGYRLTISSWENDVDHRRDIVFEGLTAADVSYLVELAKLFRTMSRHDGGFGGSAHHYKLAKRGSGDLIADVADEMDAIALKHPDISDHIRGSFAVERDEYWKDSYNEVIVQLVSFPGEDYDETAYIRVFESYTVHLIKTEIADVTTKF